MGPFVDIVEKLAENCERLDISARIRSRAYPVFEPSDLIPHESMILDHIGILPGSREDEVRMLSATLKELLERAAAEEAAEMQHSDEGSRVDCSDVVEEVEDR